MSASPRRVYRHQELQRLFNPGSIAIYGISPNPASMGARILGHMQAFKGRVHLVNPKYEAIGDRPCFASIAALPEKPDCVIMAVPRDGVEAGVLDCARGGAAGVVIFASGYAETGKPERAAMQERLGAIARDTGLKIIGPNCLGFVNFRLGAKVSFTRTELALDMPEIPRVGLVSQSGAIGFALAQAVQRGLALSHVISAGNSCDVNIADDVAFLAEDPGCASIALLYEGIADPSQLIEAGEIAWAADKPVIAVKLGLGERGATAALSHTGSMTGSTAAYKAAFERAGIVLLEGFEGLLETAAFFAKAPRRPSARGVAIMSGSGGACINATDFAEKYDVPTPAPAAHTQAVLAVHVPEFGSPRNPCDMTAMGGNDPKILPACAEALLSDPAYGALVYPIMLPGATTMKRQQQVAGIAQRLGKPVCSPFAGGWIGGPDMHIAESHPGIAVFHTVERCFAALAAWHARDERRREEAKRGAGKAARLSPPDARDKAAALIRAARARTLTEREAKAVLACYGVPVVGEALVQSAGAAARAAQELGFPVAMKVESPDIPHKTEAGVIRLNLRTAEEAKAAYAAVMKNACSYKADARINGVLVQPMVAAGTEVMVGARIDPLFGPLIVAGLGGILVELLKDTAVGLAPVTSREARAMLGRLKGRAALEGFRGSAPVDQDGLADVITRISEFADDQRELIAELDINPLICSGGRITAVDALMVRKGV
jgi:acyl-CoA synthetase (NDP forming)